MMRIVTVVLQIVTERLQSYFTKNGQYKHQVYMYVSEFLRSLDNVEVTLLTFMGNKWY